MNKLITNFIFFIYLFYSFYLKAQNQGSEYPVRKEIMTLANRFNEREGIDRLWKSIDLEEQGRRIRSCTAYIPRIDRYFRSAKRYFSKKMLDRQKAFIHYLSALKIGIFFPRNDKLYNQLKKEATDSELIALTYHQKPIVRYKSFYEILERNRTEWKTIFLAHLNDNAIVRFEGKDKMKVVDAYFDAIRGHYGDPYKQFEQETLNDLQLDSAILYHNKCKSHLVNLALFRIGNNPIHYQRVRELAQSGNWGSAALPLASYHKQEDIPIILFYLQQKKNNLAHLGYALSAVRVFPDTAFWATLLRLNQLYLNECRFLIRPDHPTWRSLTFGDEPNINLSLHSALFQYPNQKTLNLFQEQIRLFDYYDKKSGKKKKFPPYFRILFDLECALEKYPSPFFSVLYPEVHKRLEMVRKRNKKN